MHPKSTSDARIVANEPSPNENLTPEVLTPSSMSKTGNPSRNALRNNSAYRIVDDVNRTEGAANQELIHKYNSDLFSRRQLITHNDYSFLPTHTSFLSNLLNFTSFLPNLEISPTRTVQVLSRHYNHGTFARCAGMARRPLTM